MRKLIVCMALLTASPWAEAEPPAIAKCSNSGQPTDDEPFRTMKAYKGRLMFVVPGNNHVRDILREWAMRVPELRYDIEDEWTATQCWCPCFFHFEGFESFFRALRSQGVEVEKRGDTFYLRRAAVRM